MTTVGATSLAKMYSQRLVLGSQTFISTFNCPSMVSIPVLKCSLKLAQQDSWYHQDRWKPLVSGRRGSRPGHSPAPSLPVAVVRSTTSTGHSSVHSLPMNRQPSLLDGFGSPRLIYIYSILYLCFDFHLRH